jgi:hypothetical protein
VSLLQQQAPARESVSAVGALWWWWWLLLLLLLLLLVMIIVVVIVIVAAAAAAAAVIVAVVVVVCCFVCGVEGDAPVLVVTAVDIARQNDESGCREPGRVLVCQLPSPHPRWRELRCAVGSHPARDVRSLRRRHALRGAHRHRVAVPRCGAAVATVVVVAACSRNLRHNIVSQVCRLTSCGNSFSRQSSGS